MAKPIRNAVALALVLGVEFAGYVAGVTADLRVGVVADIAQVVMLITALVAVMEFAFGIVVAALATIAGRRSEAAYRRHIADKDLFGNQLFGADYREYQKEQARSLRLMDILHR